MNNPVAIAAHRVTEVDIQVARLGKRFGRLDSASRAVLAVVEPLKDHFAGLPPDRVAICLAIEGGSLSTDADFWRGHEDTGGPSPTLFAYTLPSAAIGELAIRHGLTGPNLCLVGDDASLVAAGADLIARGEADGCLCISCVAISEAAGGLVGRKPGLRAGAIYLAREGQGTPVGGENGRDMESLCAVLCPTERRAN